MLIPVIDWIYISFVSDHSISGIMPVDVLNKVKKCLQWSVVGGSRDGSPVTGECLEGRSEIIDWWEGLHGPQTCRMISQFQTAALGCSRPLALLLTSHCYCLIVRNWTIAVRTLNEGCWHGLRAWQWPDDNLAIPTTMGPGHESCCVWTTASLVLGTGALPLLGFLGGMMSKNFNMCRFLHTPSYRAAGGRWPAIWLQSPCGRPIL